MRILFVVFLMLGCRRSETPPLRVAAASDLTVAFEEIGRQFQARTGQAVVFSFGSTGLLAKQIAQGAPFDVFAAANIAFVDEVVKAGACDGTSKRPYARGRVIVWARKGSGPKQLTDLVEPRFAKIAIANPEHAPYGRAARQALEASGIWERLQGKLVFGENVQQTLKYAQTGNVDAAIVALSLAAEGDRLVIDEQLHEPLVQAMVVCREPGQAFVDLVLSPDGRAVLDRAGFARP